jgi:hypothetical protein
VLGAEAHVGVGGQVEHEVAALHGLREGGQLQVVAEDEGEGLRLAGVLEEALLAGRKVVPTHHADAVRQEAVDQV